MRKARIGAAELAYDVEGEGPAVVFLHAFPLGRFMWDGQAKAIAGSHTVLRFDDRGFGDSPPGDGLLTMEGIADDAAALMDELGLSQAVVAGCSMGGYAALAFARRHAARLRGLVLQDTRAGADSEETRAARATVAEKVRREGPRAAADAYLEKLLGETTKREKPDLVRRLREAILGTSAQGIVDALAGLAARADSLPFLREISVPTLVVCGEEDTITPVSEAEILQLGIAGSRLAVIPKAGHLSNLEEPAVYDAALRAFLAEVR
jgi:pimeloyl-ACP methyl ester carboxylesterase